MGREKLSQGNQPEIRYQWTENPQEKENNTKLPLKEIKDGQKNSPNEIRRYVEHPDGPYNQSCYEERRGP
jgi:hypothetical protein